MLEFDACVGCSEVPVGLGAVGITAVLPGGDFLDEGLLVGNPAVEALGEANYSDDLAAAAEQVFSQPIRIVNVLPMDFSSHQN